MIILSEHPADPTVINEIDRWYKRGLITADEMRRFQNEAMPRCRERGCPLPMLAGGLCAAHAVDRLLAQQQRRFHSVPPVNKHSTEA